MVAYKQIKQRHEIFSSSLSETTMNESNEE
jgi:hypothetical protein